MPVVLLRLSQQDQFLGEFLASDPISAHLHEYGVEILALYLHIDRALPLDRYLQYEDS